MPKWKKDATEFNVSVSYHKTNKVSSCYIPKPIMDFLNDPSSIIFKIRNGKVIVDVGDS